MPHERESRHSVAIVGSGPAGFYTAGTLLDAGIDVDMIERLATPWGLVRAGVAPDHPRMKSVSGQYEDIAEREGFRYFGNVDYGSDVDRDGLLAHYDAVVYAVGAQSERPLGIPGEDLPGSVASIDFVGWYNGHPDLTALPGDLRSARAVVIGNGNVALDVARMLCLPREDLARTDVADHALDPLATSGIDEVLVVGRRGAAQAAFTTAELRELNQMEGLALAVDPVEVPRGGGDDPTLSRGVAHNLTMLHKWAQAGPDPAAAKRITFRFLRSPLEIRGTDRVRDVVFAVNRLEVDVEGRVRAVDTGRRETVHTGLVVRAVGYRGVALPGLPFDPGSGTIPNTDGLVVGADRDYVVGWIKRGPTGIIGTNKHDAHETVHTLLAGLVGTPVRGLEPAAREKWIRSRQPKLVTGDDWRAIDAHERGLGAATGRPRVKVVSTDEHLRIARSRVVRSDPDSGG